MIKLRAKYPRSHYKNNNSYLYAVYRNNKEAIDKIFDPELLKQYKTTAYKGFKARLEDLKYDRYTKELYGDEPTLKNLLDRYAGSRDMRTKFEVMQDNAFSGLKSDKAAFKTFRKLVGWNEKLDPSNLLYSAKQDRYIYVNSEGKRVSFDFTNSPKGVRVYE